MPLKAMPTRHGDGGRWRVFIIRDGFQVEIFRRRIESRGTSRPESKLHLCTFIIIYLVMWLKCNTENKLFTHADKIFIWDFHGYVLVDITHYTSPFEPPIHFHMEIPSMTGDSLQARLTSLQELGSAFLLAPALAVLGELVMWSTRRRTQNGGRRMGWSVVWVWFGMICAGIFVYIIYIYIHIYICIWCNYIFHSIFVCIYISFTSHALAH